MADHFPEEILAEILLRLPPKSIVRCTSVCKSWRNLITNPSFIYHHLHHSPFPHFLLLPPYYPHDTVRYSLRHDDPLLSDTSSTLHLPPSFHFENPSTLHLAPFSNPEISVVFITHGLILCLYTRSYRCDSFFICNPSLRRFRTLPKPRFPLSVYNASLGFCIPPSDYKVSFGFGFDSQHQDYKLVRIVCMTDEKSLGLCAPYVEVYSLASRVWKDVTASAPVCTLCFLGRDTLHGHVNGVVHWGVKRKVGEGWYYFVLSFCFEDEVFGEVLLPQGLEPDPFSDVTVVGGGKDLTVYHVRGNWTYQGDIWVMKEYGVVNSWNKLFSFNWTWGDDCLELPLLGIMVNEVVGSPVPLCVRSSGELLFVLDSNEEERLYSLDVEKRTFTDLQIGTKGETPYLYSGYYRESLVLLNKASGLLSY